MKRYIQGEDRTQATLLPELLDDYVADTNPIRVVDVFVNELDLGQLGFEGVDPAATGRPAYHPAVLLKIYIYGYLNRIQSSRRLEKEAQRNVELMWLTGRLTPDFKTIADFHKDNGKVICKVCRQFVVLCQKLGLFSEALVAIDGSKFKAVTAIADRGYFKSEEILASHEAGISVIVPKPEAASPAASGRFDRANFIYDAERDEYRCPAGQILTKRFSSIEHGLNMDCYYSSSLNCKPCSMKTQCTTGDMRRIKRWENEALLDDMQSRLDHAPDAMRIRRETVEHPFGTIKFWMGATHFLTRTLDRVSTEMSLHILAYNLKRMMRIMGISELMQAMKA